MGYRSDIAICLKRDDFNTLKEEFNKTFTGEDNNDYLMNNFDVFEDDYDEDVVVFGWNSVKWYDDFDDVSFIEQFINKIAKQNKDYSFIRIGEGYSDIEERDNYITGDCNKISCHREIIID